MSKLDFNKLYASRVQADRAYDRAHAREMCLKARYDKLFERLGTTTVPSKYDEVSEAFSVYMKARLCSQIAWDSHTAAWTAWNSAVAESHGLR